MIPRTPEVSGLSFFYGLAHRNYSNDIEQRERGGRGRAWSNLRTSPASQIDQSQ
jgi:hypothetical protein